MSPGKHDVRFTRSTPTDLDEAPDKTLKPVLEFDITKANKYGSPTWPERWFGQKFGPSLIRKSLASGLCVVAEIKEIPYPVAIKEARWMDGSLEVLTLEGWRLPERLFTRSSMVGFTSSGLLKEEKET